MTQAISRAPGTGCDLVVSLAATPLAPHPSATTAMTAGYDATERLVQLHPWACVVVCSRYQLPPGLLQLVSWLQCMRGRNQRGPGRLEGSCPQETQARSRLGHSHSQWCC